MLTFDYPEIVHQIAVLPGGLIPIWPDGKLALAIKVSKEALLTTRLNGGFSVYVVPIPAADGITFGIVTAMFDDADEPLTIRTPLFGDEEHSVEIVGILMAPEVNIHFFDNVGREWMSYRCELHDPGSFLKTSDSTRLLPFSPANSTAILNILGEWFGLRTAEDDACAIKVKLCEELWPSDLAILDLRDDQNEYLGSDGYAISTLTRDAGRPGYYQERDIVACLKRFLAPDQIILNPIRRGTDKEFVDVAAGTADSVLLIQAKDSPNTALSLGRSIERKRLASESQLKGALKQVKGALRYAADGDPIRLTTKHGDIDLHVHGRKILSVAIIREIFPAQTATIVQILREHADRGQTLIVLDFPGFSAFVHHFPEEVRFVAELEDYACALMSGNEWITPHAFLVGRFLDERAAREDGAGESDDP